MQYDVIIVGAGPGGIFTAYELSRLNREMKIAVMEAGHAQTASISTVSSKQTRRLNIRRLLLRSKYRYSIP